MKRIYLDHAATTPVRPEAVEAMLPYFSQHGYNASSTHAEGRAARAALDDARERVARVLGCKPKEIVFTAGGTEADNLALIGVAEALRERRAGRHVVTTRTEHHAVLHACDFLRGQGYDITVLDVDESGRLEPSAFAAALREDTILAAVMYANNEIGTLQPIAELARLAHAHGAPTVFFTDAVQAPGQLPIRVDDLGVDLLAISAHKFYGPKGVGVLYVREGTPLAPIVHGGGQEHGRRSGTENVAGVVGLAAALELAEAERPAAAVRLATLRDRLEDALLERVPEIQVNGRASPRLPNNLSVSFSGLEAEPLLIALDLEGVAASAGSACAAGSLEPSHVIAALGLDPPIGGGTIRFSLGRTTTADEIDRVADIVPALVARQRGAGALSV
ncbi:MAG: cysteine desulfurase [Candidatus Eremiobacteraeota bacterium]|nr:cysteine desulfurase [Candidatus Eremiobacteraeota bacterium]